MCVTLCVVCALDPEPFATIRPVVLMHGLGDAGSNPGMQSLAKSIMAKCVTRVQSRGPRFAL